MGAKKIDWKKYEVNNFSFVSDDNIDRDRIECGSWALYTLTGKSYDEIAKLCKDGNWTNRIMLKALKAAGCEVIPLGIGNLVEAWTVDGKQSRPKLGNKHVLLVEQHVHKPENTWSVIYQNHISHSSDIDPLSPIEFINYPIAQAYLVYNKKWK